MKDSEWQYEKFFSSYKELEIVKKTDRVKIELVYHEERQSVCILKIYYSRDLTDIYRRLMQLPHKNLAVVYDTIFYEGNTWVLEEMIDGETLAEHLENYGVMDEQQVIPIIFQLCEGLKFLHAQNPPLIHRDIKPSNVILKEDGSVKLIDFDTVRVYQENKEEDTRALGTKAYASPEHFGYGQTGPASDIYSVGVLMNELLTGEVLEKHELTYRGRIAPVIRKCIQTDAERRIRTAEALEKEISTYQHKWGILVRNRRRIVLGATAIALAVVLILAIVPGAGERWPDLQAAFESETEPHLLLENARVDAKMKKLLGTNYSYVSRCMDYVSSGSIRYEDACYFMAGGMPGLYTIMEAAVSLHENGQIECAYLENSDIFYYSSDEVFYDKPTDDMLNWMSGFEGKEIYFNGKKIAEAGKEISDAGNQEFAVSDDFTGTYICKDREAVLEITKNEAGSYQVNGVAQWGSNLGDVNGVLEQKSSNQFSFMYDWDRESGDPDAPELFLNIYEDYLVAREEPQGAFGGLNVSFDGIYEKQ